MSESIEYDISELADEPVFGDDWTQSAQERLYLWKRRGLQLRELHEQAMFMNRAMFIRIKTTAILMSVVTSLLLAFNQQFPGLYLEQWSILTAGAVSFLASYDFLLSPQESYVSHRQAVGALTHLANTVNYFCSLKPSKRPDVEVAYVMVTNEMLNIETTAPPVRHK